MLELEQKFHGVTTLLAEGKRTRLGWSDDWVKPRNVQENHTFRITEYQKLDEGKLFA